MILEKYIWHPKKLFPFLVRGHCSCCTKIWVFSSSGIFASLLWFFEFFIISNYQFLRINHWTDLGLFGLIRYYYINRDADVLFDERAWTIGTHQKFTRFETTKFRLKWCLVITFRSPLSGKPSSPNDQPANYSQAWSRWW